MAIRVFRLIESAVVAVCLLPALPVSAQVPAPSAGQEFAAGDRLPFDPAVTIGTLPNGLRYYVRRNTQPEKRVSLRLAVRAGSIDESDDQQGLAHVVEHMAFNGSRRFKPGELVATFEGTGARLGPHVNAHTGFDETVYTLTLPTDRDGIVLKGIQALSDVAGGLLMASEDIEKQRGVVLAELRGGLGSDSRLREQQIPVLYYKSKYAERLPIGKPEVLRTFTPERLRAFYTTWYRPERMALVIVGDIDVAQIDAAIRLEFAAPAVPVSPVPATAPDLPLTAELLVSVSSDPEATQSLVSIARKKSRARTDRVADYRRDLVDRLVVRMINERFDEVSQKPDPPFLGAGAYETALSPTVGTFTLSAAVADGRLAAGVGALQVESKRARQYGFAPAELERARTWMLSAYDRAFSDRDKTESDDYAQEYVSNFLEQEPSPGIDYEYRLAQALIPAISTADVASAAAALFADDSRVILATARRNPEVSVPTEAQLRDALISADAATVAEWTDVVSSTVLMDRVPDAGAITSTRTVPALGLTIVRFANGVEGWFKSTLFENDQVLFALTSPGGTSLATAAQYPEAQLATAHVQLSGVGGHTALAVQKLLAGLASARPFMRTSSHGISGWSAAGSLETALQLLNLTFTAPGDSAPAYAQIRRQLEAAYANRANNPGLLFAEKLSQVNSRGHFTSQPLTLDRIATLDRGAIASFYKARFSNAADFTFFMVGAFSADVAIPLAARYVGSLPSTGSATVAFKDPGVTFPASIERVTVEKGRAARAQAVLSFFAEPAVDGSDRTRLDAAVDVLRLAVRGVLREEPGAADSVSVTLSQPLPQRGGGHVSVGFAVAPAAMETTIARVLKEITVLEQEGPPINLLFSAKEAARRQHELALTRNGFWLSSLESAKLLNRDPALVLRRRREIDEVTRQNVRDMFRKYLPLNRYTLVTLMPERQ